MSVDDKLKGSSQFWHNNDNTTRRNGKSKTKTIKNKKVTTVKTQTLDGVSYVPMTYESLKIMDAERMKILEFSRHTDSMCITLMSICKSVLPDIFLSPVFWWVWIVYSVFVTMIVTDVWLGAKDEETGDLKKAFSGIEMFVAFFIIFYVGDCFARYRDQYNTVRRVQGRFTDACHLARLIIPDPYIRKKLWRYVNLCHITAYCGISGYYNYDNLFKPLCEEKHIYLEPEELQWLEEYLVENNMSIEDFVDDTSGRAYKLFFGWVLQLVHDTRSRCAHPDKLAADLSYAAIRTQLMKARIEIKALYNYVFRVIPFKYTHLVTMVTTLYLMTFAIDKALLVREVGGLGVYDGAAFWTFGVFFPILNILVVMISSLGLIMMGQALSMPFGMDDEDFPVFNFIISLVDGSRNVILSKDAPCLKRPVNKAKEGITNGEGDATAAAHAIPPASDLGSEMAGSGL